MQYSEMHFGKFQYNGLYYYLRDDTINHLVLPTIIGNVECVPISPVLKPSFVQCCIKQNHLTVTGLSACIRSNDLMQALGVGVIFEKEGINTMSLGDEMLLNTFTAIAQEESKAISQNQRLSIVKRMELGVYVDSNAPYGFHLENKQLVEYPPEADIVRWIFQAYLRGMSTAEIAKDLSDRGVPTKNGKEKWKSSKISYMLSNERYIGDCCYQKTYRGTTVPFKQSKNRGEEDMYYATGTHAPIVEKDLFEKVQVLLKKRKEQFTKATTQNIYPLSSRIRCSECGSFYRRKVRSGGVKWVCARHEEDFKACNSNYYSEERRRGTHVACGEQPSGHRYS